MDHLKNVYLLCFGFLAMRHCANDQTQGEGWWVRLRRAGVWPCDWPLSLRWGQPFTCGVQCQLQADAVGTEFSCRTGSWYLEDGSVRKHPTLPAALMVTSIGCREETRLAFERPAGALESWRQT